VKAIKGPAMVVSDQCDGSASSRCASHYWRADTVLRQNSISRAHVEMQRRRRVSPKKIAALIAEPHSMKPTQKNANPINRKVRSHRVEKFS
jgi:hypothetical protein